MQYYGFKYSLLSISDFQSPLFSTCKINKSQVLAFHKINLKNIVETILSMQGHDMIDRGNPLRSLVSPSRNQMVPYPPSYGLNSITTVLFRRMALALNNLQKVDMPLSKETKPEHQGGVLVV